MAEYIAIPKLGMSMTEATLIEWKATEGDKVNQGDVVLTIETEKTQWEVEAAADGFVHIVVDADIVAPVGRVVGLIAETEEELQTLQKESIGEIYTTVQESAEEPVAEEPAEPASAPSPVTGDGKRIRISPVARKIAEENMIDITTVAGSGPDGRIIREDIQRAIEAKKEVKVAEKIEAPAGEVIDGKTVKTTIPLKSMRKVIAEHMHRSLSVSAQLTNMGEIDMAEMVKYRKSFIEQQDTIGTRISYTDIMVYIVARALKEYPIINSSLAGDEIKLWEDINIGVAVAIVGGFEGGLIVPVVKNADKKSLIEISKEVKELTEKGRNNKLLPDEVSGGTFTITNLGTLDIGYGFGTPIINQPQLAILGTGPIKDRPAVVDGEIVIRPIMTYSFTFDHRAIDGAPAAMFMMHLVKLIEHPELLML